MFDFSDRFDFSDDVVMLVKRERGIWKILPIQLMGIKKNQIKVYRFGFVGEF